MRLKHFFACLLAVALLCGCTPRAVEVQAPPVQSPPEPEQAEPTYPPQPPAPPAHATLLAVGDPQGRSAVIAVDQPQTVHPAAGPAQGGVNGHPGLVCVFSVQVQLYDSRLHTPHPFPVPLYPGTSRFASPLSRDKAGTSRGELISCGKRPPPRPRARRGCR